MKVKHTGEVKQFVCPENISTPSWKGSRKGTLDSYCHYFWLIFVQRLFCTSGEVIFQGELLQRILNFKDGYILVFEGNY